MAGRGGGSSTVKASLAGVLFVSFLWFLFVGVLANNQATKADIVEATMIPPRNFDIWKLIRSKRRHSLLHHTSDFNYVSKRRVPNGPDPIHNRRAGEYRQPPLQH